MFQFLLVLHALIAATLVTVILMQRSEGGGLGMGGSPSGLMSARGAADFLTRATAVLGTLFVGLSVVLAVYASTGHTSKIDASLQRRAAPAAPLPGAMPKAGEEVTPFAAGAANALAPADNAAAPVDNGAVPLAR